MDSTPTHSGLLPNEIIVCILSQARLYEFMYEGVPAAKKQLLKGAYTNDGRSIPSAFTVAMDCWTAKMKNLPELTQWPNSAGLKLPPYTNGTALPSLAVSIQAGSPSVSEVVVTLEPIADEMAAVSEPVAPPMLVEPSPQPLPEVKVRKVRGPRGSYRTKAVIAAEARTSLEPVDEEIAAPKAPQGNGTIDLKGLDEDEIHILGRDSLIAEVVIKKKGRRRKFSSDVPWNPKSPSPSISVTLETDVTFWDIFDPYNRLRRVEYEMGTVHRMHLRECKLMPTQKMPAGMPWYLVDKQQFGLPVWIIRFMTMRSFRFAGRHFDSTKYALSITEA